MMASSRRVERSSGLSMLREHRRHTTVHDFHTAVAVSAISGAAQPVEYLQNFVQSDGRAVFWFEGEGASARVVADANVFAADQLTVVDATRLQRGETSRVGSLRMPAVLPLDVMAELLVTADVVRTYIHEGSSLTMDLLSADASSTAFRFSGTHKFFTNRRHLEPVNFEVRFDHEGNVTVASADQRLPAPGGGELLPLASITVAPQSNVGPRVLTADVDSKPPKGVCLTATLGSSRF